MENGESVPLAAAATVPTDDASNGYPPPSAKPKRIPPKRKKGKLSKKARGDGNRKRSGYDFGEAKAAYGISPSSKGDQELNAAVISSLPITSASSKKIRSPSKGEVKRQRDRGEKREAEQVKIHTQLIQAAYKKEDTIIQLKAEKKDLVHQLKMEKKASNTLIQSTMATARITMDDALALMDKARDLDDKLEAEVSFFSTL